MLHNDKNTPPFPVIQGPVIVMLMSDEPPKKICVCCGDDL